MVCEEDPRPTLCSSPEVVNEKFDRYALPNLKQEREFYYPFSVFIFSTFFLILLFSF